MGEPSTARLAGSGPRQRGFLAAWLDPWGAYRPWWWLVLVTASTDGLTTWLFMHELGVEAELHPAIRLVATWWGPTAGVLIGKAVQVAALWVLCLLRPSWTRPLCGLVALSYLAASCWNLHLLAQAG